MHPRELQSLHPNLRIVDTYDLMSECKGLTRALGWAHRLITGRLFCGCVQLQFSPD